MTNVETVELNDENYIELLVDEINGNTYVYLMNVNDNYDFHIRKIVKENDKLYYVNLDTEEEFDNVFKIMIEKIKTNIESLG